MKGRARWVEQINGGRVLHADEIASMGQKGLSAYLRAMDVKIGQAMQKDAEGMRELLRISACGR